MGTILAQAVGVSRWTRSPEEERFVCWRPGADTRDYSALLRAGHRADDKQLLVEGRGRGGRGIPHAAEDASAFDSPAVRPTLSASALISAAPACDTILMPSAVTRRPFSQPAVFTYQVLHDLGRYGSQQLLSSQVRSTSHCCRAGQLNRRREFSGPAQGMFSCRPSCSRRGVCSAQGMADGPRESCQNPGRSPHAPRIRFQPDPTV